MRNNDTADDFAADTEDDTADTSRLLHLLQLLQEAQAVAARIAHSRVRVLSPGIEPLPVQNRGIDIAETLHVLALHVQNELEGLNGLTDGTQEQGLLSPEQVLLPPVTVTGLLHPDWGRCDYCGEKPQHRHFLVTSTEHEGEAKACVTCKVTDLPLPVVLWAREQDIAHIKWQKVKEAQAAAGEDAFLVGDTKLLPVTASRPADKQQRREEHQRRYYAGWFHGPFEKRNVVYWYEDV